METIQNYLDNMFLGLPTNSKIIEAKNDLYEMMADKYSELINEGKTDNEAVGIVISQFGNLGELSETLGIKEEYQNKEYSKEVNLIEASEYMKNIETNSPKIGNGVMAIILSTAAIMIYELLVQKEIISEMLRNILSIGGLLFVVAIAVYFFITAGSDTEKFEYLKKENFNLSNDAKKYTQNYQNKLNFIKIVARNVLAVILSVIPIIVMSQIDERDIYILPTVALLLIVVAIVTRSFIVNGMKYEATQVLLQEEEFSKDFKESNKSIELFGSIYWPIVTIAYFASSFITKEWDITWVIWPIAGILFGIISTIIRSRANN